MAQTNPVIQTPSRLHPNRPHASAIDVAKAILGMWLFVSTAALTPHTISNGVSAPLVNNMVVGGLLILSGVTAAMGASSTDQVLRPIHRRNWSLFTLAVSVWLVISPWILGYGGATRIALNSVLCGVVLAALSLANLRLSRTLGHDYHRGFVR